MAAEKIEFSGNIMQQFLATGGVFLFVGEKTETNLQLAQAIRDLPRSCEVVIAVVNQDLIDAINNQDQGNIAPIQPSTPTESYLAWLMADFNRIVADKDVKAAENWLDVNGFKGWWDHRVNDDTPQAEVDRTIFEQFHHAYDRWSQDQIRDLIRSRSDIIFPNTPSGRRMAMFKDEN